MAYAVASGSGGGPTGQALLRGFTLMLASGLAVVLIFSSCKRNIIGLWVSLICAAIPLLWVSVSLLTRRANAGCGWSSEQNPSDPQPRRNRWVSLRSTHPTALHKQSASFDMRRGFAVALIRMRWGVVEGMKGIASS